MRKKRHQRYARKSNAVLIADDDLYIRTVIQVALQKIVYVVHAVSGDEVVPAYKKHNPDIVFLDFHMPGKNSQDVLREILAYDKNAFVVMMSADEVALTVQQSLDSGAKGFLVKPFSKEKLLQYILDNLYGNDLYLS